MPKNTNKGSNSSASSAEKYSHVPQNESKGNTLFPFGKRTDGFQKNAWISNGRDTRENLEETELRHFKCIHIAPDLAALGFRAWSPAVTLRLGPNRQLIQRIKMPLHPSEKREGCIYVFQRKEVFGLCKVGHTTHNVNQRLRFISKRCHQSPQKLYQRQVRNVPRVEALIHIDLAEHRQVEKVCNLGNGCYCAHWEWFALSPDKVVAIIERWAQWMDSEPYNAKNTLDDRWLKQVEMQVGKEPQIESLT